MMVAARLESISICSKLKLRQVTTINIKLNYIVVFAAIMSAQSNLGADSKAPPSETSIYIILDKLNKLLNKLKIQSNVSL